MPLLKREPRVPRGPMAMLRLALILVALIAVIVVIVQSQMHGSVDHTPNPQTSTSSKK